MRYRHSFSHNELVDLWAVFSWCAEQFGQAGWAHSTWAYKEGVWHFAREKDYLLFVLRWL